LIRFSTLVVAALLTAQTAWAQDAAPQFPRTMAWSAYNLGTTGYNQAVAIGKVLKDHYDVNLRVVPGKNDVSRLMPLVQRRVQYSANGVATYFAQEGVFQFANANWGPLPLRIVMMSYGDSNQALGVAADSGVRTYAELRGKRVPYVRGAPAINVPTEAFLACGGLTWDDVERVDFPGYNAMWTGVVNGQVDAAYATTVSGPTRKLEASPRGIFWPPAPHDDAACWAHVATRGAGISASQPHEGATYPYPILITLPQQPVQEVHDLARVIHRHYDEFKEADPGAIGWALERQIRQWSVPYHRGSVDYFRSIGVWTAADDAHNERLLQRQAVLAAAWQNHVEQAPDDEAFVSRWYAVRAEALTEAGFDPIWVDAGAG